MPRLVVNLVAKAGGINDCQGDTSSLLIQFELCWSCISLLRPYLAQKCRKLTDGNGLDADTLLKVSISGIIGVFALQHLLAAESVHEGCAP